MALQNFIDKALPVISAAWANAVDVLKFTVFADAATKAQARAAITSDAPFSLGQGGTGAITAETARAALNARRQGLVTLIRTDPTATDVAWKAYAPDGSLINIAASTTDGFAEAHTYAQTNNYALSVEGGGITTAKPNANVIAFLTSTRQTLGPCDSQIYDIKGVNFTFAGQGLTSGTALSVDSFSKGLLNFDGQVVCNHAGTALEFIPSTNHTSDSNKNQGVADFLFRVVQNASQAAGAVVISFNAQTGTSLNGSNYRFEEINGGETGVLFTTVGSGVITGCRFNLWGVHGYLDAANGVGLHIDTTGVSACQINMETSTPANAGYTARINSIACDYNIFDLTSGAVKILLNTGATKNELHIFAPNASGLTLTDNATVKTNRVWFNGTLITGLAFPATAVGNTDPNTLDDYEESTWTPTLSFQTPGNLNVVYGVQLGSYTKVGRIVYVTFCITTTTFTHTTASGSCVISGLPFTSKNTTNLKWLGTCIWTGITKAGYTNISSQVNESVTSIEFIASGSAQALSAVAAADTPTGGTIILRGSISYEI